MATTGAKQDPGTHKSGKEVYSRHQWENDKVDFQPKLLLRLYLLRGQIRFLMGVKSALHNGLGGGF